MSKIRVLIVEDDPVITAELRGFLQETNYEVLIAENGFSAERIWRSAGPDLAIIDCDLREGGIADLMARLRSVDRFIPVIALTGYGSMQTAMETVRLGAVQFLTKPVELLTLRVLIDRSLENQRNHRAHLAEASRLGRHFLDPLLGKSHAMRSLRDSALRAALSESPVLIEGEAGTGKGDLACWLHQNGLRASESFVVLSCNDFSRSQAETELFGNVEDGPAAKTDARPSLLEIAHRGTLFLDAVGELPASIQTRLLRLLEERKFHKGRNAKEHWVDVRLIAATHQPMTRLVQGHHFRGELYSRLRTIVLTLPPLRERREDISALASAVLEGLSATSIMGPLQLTSAASLALQNYSWPGNLRELRTVLERAALVACDSVLTERDLSFEVFSQSLETTRSDKTLEEVERHYIHQVLQKEGGHVESAAKKLGIPRSSLYHKLKQYRGDDPANLQQQVS
jgi:DNA-binding NtrC family response regulator